MGFARREEMRPLTRRQFELGVDGETEDWMRRVYAFLSKNRNLAYTTEELLTEFAPRDPNEESRLVWALDTLVDVWAAEVGMVAGIQYYIFFREVDTSIWAPILEPQGSSASGETL